MVLPATVGVNNGLALDADSERKTDGIGGAGGLVVALGAESGAVCIGIDGLMAMGPGNGFVMVKVGFGSGFTPAPNLVLGATGLVGGFTARLQLINTTKYMQAVPMDEFSIHQIDVFLN
jgi:hypothetical protein